MSAATTTPLLLLLDGVLSQDETRTREAVSLISEKLRELHQVLPTTGCPLNSRPALHAIVYALLSACPDDISVRSSHDNSLPLHFAASLGDIHVANMILMQNPQAAGAPNAKGKTPLHYAAREGRTEMVRFFMRAAPHTAAIASKKRKLALHFAAGDGHVEVVQSLLGVYPQGASLQSAKGKLPLHFAARWNHLQIASDLLQVYPDGVRALDWEGSLPLHEAAREGQYQMSRFLLERFPSALSTANLRGEIPLFPAVRSGNVDLVVLLLQAWPVGGKHILKSISEDDNISDWGWDILELVLRGAAGNFFGCALLRGREPPTVRLADDLSAVKVPEQPPDTPKRKKKSKRATPDEDRTVVRLAEASSSHGPFQEDTNYLEPPFCRSKSPILADDTGNYKRRSNERKRRRIEQARRQDSLAEAYRPFIPLHASLECGASANVVRHVVGRCRSDLELIDHLGRTPLHWAVAGCRQGGDEWVRLILEEGLIRQSLAKTRDHEHRLPLHLAVESGADVRVIEALLDVHPAAGVEMCQTRDEWHDAKPVHLASYRNCDLSTVYRLLRVDPGVLEQAN